MPSGRVAAPPDVFLGDLLWLARYPLLYGALTLLIRARGLRFGLGQVVDGLLGAFAAAAVFVLVMPHLAPAGASSATAGLRSIYPAPRRPDRRASSSARRCSTAGGWPTGSR